MSLFALLNCQTTILPYLGILGGKALNAPSRNGLLCILMCMCIGGCGLSYSHVPSHSDEDLSHIIDSIYGHIQYRYTSGDLGARKAFTPEAQQVHKQRKTSPPLPLSLEQQVTSQKTSLLLARDGEAGKENMDRAHSR